MSHAAVLCPSFYRASIVDNPDGRDLFRMRLRARVVGFLQRRLARKLALA